MPCPYFFLNRGLQSNRAYHRAFYPLQPPEKPLQASLLNIPKAESGKIPFALSDRSALESAFCAEADGDRVKDLY